MTDDKRPADSDDVRDALLPEWLRENSAADGTFELPNWLDEPEAEDEALARAVPPEVAVPRVSTAWVTRAPAADADRPATTAAAAGISGSRWLSAPLIAVAALLAIAAALFVALVVW
ncbi:MAG TPA: hypothetical protein PKA95_09810 [Thermomicrobiales bacterium]|nr:hypothetical protein [Thermomicrobiales bacterium]